MRPPPTPPGHPLLGHYLAFRRDRLAFYHDAARTYGDIIRLRFGPVDTYLVSHPDTVRHILQDNQRAYGRHAFGNRLLRFLTGEGILTTEGSTWLRQRRLAQPAFHRQRIAAFGTLMTDATLAMLARWHPLAARAEPFNLASEMSRLTMEIAGKALFSTDISDAAHAIGQVARVGVEYARDRAVTLFPFLLALPTARNRRYRRAREEADRLIYTLIATRRRQPEEAHHDLLALLMAARDEETGEGMSDRQLHDEMVTMLFAGQETTAAALTWCFHLLSDHPDVEETLHEELRRVLSGRAPIPDDLPHLPYTRMVLDETLRLYPPIWIMGRSALVADEVGGYTLPARALIAISPYVVHRHPAFWPDPERFDPHRFAAEPSAARPRFAYFPFGGGPRQCIGNTFALTEATLVLATVVQHCRLRCLSSFRVEPEPLLTLRPRNGLMVTASERG